MLELDPRLPESLQLDLQADNMHPDVIRAVAEGLRAAGLERIAFAGG
jgi:hypothetical protein